MNQRPDLWQVELQGPTSDLEHLVIHSATGPYRVFKDERDESFAYESDAFAACETAQDVLKLANGELCVFSGVLRLMRNSSEALRARAVYRRNASGSRDIFVCIQEGLRMGLVLGEVAVTFNDAEGGLISKSPSAPRTVKTIRLAVSDPSVAKAMRLLALAEPESWVNMYRIHEVIEADVGSQKSITDRGWVSSQDLKRFKHSANSVVVAGDDARHGKEVQKPPKRPMLVDEASAYLNHVLQSWLSSKGV